MKIQLTLFVSVEGISEEEFILNWVHQVPHWHYLTDEGISFFKGMRPRKWKK